MRLQAIYRTNGRFERDFDIAEPLLPLPRRIRWHGSTPAFMPIFQIDGPVVS
jgi:hypothetical protein